MSTSFYSRSFAPLQGGWGLSRQPKGLALKGIFDNLSHAVA